MPLAQEVSCIVVTSVLAALLLLSCTAEAWPCAQSLHMGTKRPFVLQGMGALVVSNSRDGSGGAAPAAADVRANSMPSTLGEALQRAQMEQHIAQIAAGKLL